MTGVLAVLDAVINSLWQAAAVAALVWLALRFARRANAATRHAIWWAALGVVLMLPLAPRVIALLSSHARPHTIAQVAIAPKPVAPSTGFEPVVIRIEPASTSKWPLVIVAIWAAILVWRLTQIGRSYVYLRGVKRRGTLSTFHLPAIPRRARLLISRDAVSPMAVGFLNPAVIFPETLIGEISERDREHVLLHEAAHLARYDDWINLAMRLLGGALALHPVAIWILRRIEREREMICDDWVVARTGAARPYAASLAHLFELRHSRAAAGGEAEALASGILGRTSHLGDRIELLLRRGRTFSSRASLAGTAASALALSALLLAGSLTPRWIAFAQQQPRPSFEVASIKPHKRPGNGELRDRESIDTAPGSLMIRNASLQSCIKWAYNVTDYQIAGPAWLIFEKYDISAKAAGPAPLGQLRQMLQTLLGDRFHLQFHRETKQLPVYILAAAKSGPKLHEAEPGGNTDMRGENGSFVFRGTSMPQFAENLSTLAQVDRPVLDRTGIPGVFDFRLKFGDGESDIKRALVAGDGPSIFTLVQEQLGLKLEARKGPVEILVVDHAEKPDAN